MKKIALVLIALALFCSVRARAQEQKFKLEDFAWLAGCWENDRAGRVGEERWTKPKAGMMLGTGQTVKDGKTVEFEFMRIHEEKGDILFTAKPSGQPEASFKLVSYKDGKAVFENPQHDFPQRVIYGKQPDGSLLARIEGEMAGQQRGIDFPFKRAKCE
jgi:hypothetical protein